MSDPEIPELPPKTDSGENNDKKKPRHTVARVMAEIQSVGKRVDEAIGILNQSRQDSREAKDAAGEASQSSQEAKTAANQATSAIRESQEAMAKAVKAADPVSLKKFGMLALVLGAVILGAIHIGTLFVFNSNNQILQSAAAETAKAAESTKSAAASAKGAADSAKSAAEAARESADRAGETAEAAKEAASEATRAANAARESALKSEETSGAVLSGVEAIIARLTREAPSVAPERALSRRAFREEVPRPAEDTPAREAHHEAESPEEYFTLAPGGIYRAEISLKAGVEMPEWQILPPIRYSIHWEPEDATLHIRSKDGTVIEKSGGWFYDDGVSRASFKLTASKDVKVTITGR